MSTTPATTTTPVTDRRRGPDAETVLKAIATRSYATLATVSSAGRPHVAGVLYAAVGRTLYVSTDRSSRKARNIAATPEVAVTIPVRRVPVGPPSAVQFQGTAELSIGREGHAGFTRVDACEHFFMITADPAADSPIEGTETLARATKDMSAEFERVATDEDERAARLAQVQRTEADFGEPMPFGVEAARAFAQVAADIRRTGRKTRARALDALIAATAKSAGLPLYTFNADDLRGVSGLEVVSLPRRRSEP